MQAICTRNLRPPACAAGLTLALAMLLAGCGGSGPPTGQVIARVDGVEITASDIVAEARATGMAATSDDRATYTMLVERVIDRAVLAQMARRQKLDRSSTYFVDMKRLQEDYLAKLALRSAINAPVKPDAAAIERYMGAHSAAFADRNALKLDQLSFALTDDKSGMRFLNEAETLDDVQMILTSMAIPYARKVMTADEAALPGDLARRIEALPPKALFSYFDGGGAHVATILARSGIHLDPADRDALAERLLARADTDAQVRRIVQASKSKMKIEYQAGYAPAR